jgi:glucokinase
MILTGDIGGTKTWLALFEEGDPFSLVRKERYVSHEHKDLTSIISLFLSQEKVNISRAAFGVAGPVVDERCHATNLPWVIDANWISGQMKIPNVFLLNDLEANAWGIRCLKSEDFCDLNRGVPHDGNMAVISAGTGLGEAGLYWNGKSHRPFGCEGGHVDFAPLDDLEIELLIFLRKKYGRISYERLVSGPGLCNIYRFFIETGKERECPPVLEEMKTKDPAKVISEAALTKKCRACERALDLFVSIYGAEAGNLALKILAVGGVFIGGGIAPKILPVLQSGIFLRSFTAKGRLKGMVSAIPVKVILSDNVNLLGAAFYAREH